MFSHDTWPIDEPTLKSDQGMVLLERVAIENMTNVYIWAPK